MPSKPSQLGALGLMAALLALTPATPPVAQAGIDQETNIDGYDPAAESFRVNEARRLNAINRQLELKYRMLWWNGWDPANPPVEQPIGHESEQVGPNQWIYRPVYPETVVPLEGEPVERGPELLPVPEARQALPAPQPGPVIVPALPGNGGPAKVAPGGKLPGPSDARPGDRIAPKKRAPAARGPREF